MVIAGSEWLAGIIIFFGRTRPACVCRPSAVCEHNHHVVCLRDVVGFLDEPLQVNHRVRRLQRRRDGHQRVDILLYNEAMNDDEW